MRMARRVLPYVALVGLLSLLSACSVYDRPKRPAWRTAADNACFAEKDGAKNIKAGACATKGAKKAKKKSAKKKG